jgi:hypothetical protein
MTGLSAGYAIGFVGDSVCVTRFIFTASIDVALPKCVRAYVYESKVFVSMVLIMIFAEVLGLYGYVHAAVMPFLKTKNLRIYQTHRSIDYELKGYWGGMYLTCIALFILRYNLSDNSTHKMHPTT